MDEPNRRYEMNEWGIVIIKIIVGGQRCKSNAALRNSKYVDVIVNASANLCSHLSVHLFPSTTGHGTARFN